MDPEILEVVKLLFARRLEAFRHAVESEAEVDEASTAMARGARVAACNELFRGHCTRVLKDYVAVLELFDVLAERNGLQSTFDAHVDAAAAELLSAFGASGQAERNRVTNQNASIKASSGVELNEAIARAQTAKTSGANAPDELDDRLPLGRRGAFDRDLERHIADAKRDGEPLSLVMIDIDHFKKVNDVHGHPVGDEVLLQVAKMVVHRAACKGAAYRFGGEEFSLLLPRYTPEEAVGLAERIRKDLEQAVVSSKKLAITASFGVAGVPDHAEKAAALLEAADGALYEAKRAGRNRVAVP